MPEDVSDLFESRSAAHHGRGQSVAEDVSAGAWSADSGLPQQTVYQLGPEPIATYRWVRRPATEKHSAFSLTGRPSRR
jgi:hypothetical protein